MTGDFVYIFYDWRLCLNDLLQGFLSDLFYIL